MKYRPYFVRGDLDGFFGLFIDNLFQLMLITLLCRQVCGFSSEFITGRILPGAAFSILAGNLFFSWQAYRYAKRVGRQDVTALPFGINTISLLAFVFFVMSPIYYETGDPDLAWRAGLAACFISGIIETLGVFFGAWIKKHTPRPALLSGLAGIALSFMTLGFSIQAFNSPTLALVPLGLVIIFYGARIRFPLRIPAGLAAVGFGVLVAWTLRHWGFVDFSLSQEPISFGWHWPHWALGDLVSILVGPKGWTYVAVVAPIGIFNIINSIQNLESAEAEGDNFPVRSSLLANGLSTLLASLFGSPFPTAIYIGHPGWKDMGARRSYSVLNGIVITLMCLLGGINLFLRFIPLEIALGILLWIGLIIVAQAFQKTDDRQAIAVVVGLIPPLAAWVLHIVETSLRAAGSDLYTVFNQLGAELYIHGIISLYQGFLVTAVVLAAIVSHILERRFLKAGLWCFAASSFSFFGMIHAYKLTPTGIQNYFGWNAAPDFAACYAILALALFIINYSNAFKTIR